MATTGPNQGLAATEYDAFECPWTNIANAVSQDSSYATNDFSIGSITNGVDVIGFGTFTGIGAGDTVTDINIEVRCFVDTASNFPTFDTAQLLLSGAVRGDAGGVSAAIPTSVAYVDSGLLSIAGLSTTLIGSQVNDATFGVRLVFRAFDSGQTLSVDAVRVTLTYTPAAAEIIGEAALTQAANTVSSSGSVSVVGTASITQGADTISAAGTVVNESVSGGTSNPGMSSALSGMRSGVSGL